MRKLLRPQIALTLLGSAPRVTAQALRVTGAVMRLLADQLDPRGSAPTRQAAPPDAQRSSDPSSRERPQQREGGSGFGPRAPQRSARPGVNGHPAGAGAGTGEAAPSQSSGPARTLRTVEATPEPPHVSEQVELVGEFADPGAEEGAGATVHVKEPWASYAKLHADQVIDRMGAVSDSELALVALYEQTHRRRRTVLDAAAAEMRARANRADA